MSKPPIVIRATLSDCQVGEYVWEDGRQREFWDKRHPYEIMVAEDNQLSGVQEFPPPIDERPITRLFEPKVLGIPTGETRPGYPRSKPERAWLRVK